MKININGVDKQLQINSLQLSPIYAKVQYTTDMGGYYIDDKYDIEIRLENENGQEYQTQYMTPNYNKEEKSCKVVIGYRNIFKDSKEIKLTPVVTNLKTGELIEQESITIDLDKNN